MQDKQLYLDSNLTLASLARETEIPLHHLSQIINASLGQNFYDFINSQRIQEAQARLAAPGGCGANIAAIAFEVGFNTLSSFNAAFKKFTGMTPSQYKKSLAKTESPG